MLNNGIILLSILIDSFIEILKIVEWITPIKNLIILITSILIFKYRWTWQVLLPSWIVYNSSKIKGYLKDRINETQSLGKLDLLLRANSLTQHALFLKDRIYWIYREEIDFCLEAFYKGNLTLPIRLLFILLIIVLFGVLNQSSLVIQLGFLHVITKQCKFGQLYMKETKIFIKNCSDFFNFAYFYDNLEFYSFPPPFNLVDDEFSIEIVETIEGTTVTFESGGIYLTSEHLKSIKPIVNLMTESISHWYNDIPKHSSTRKWKWTRILKYDYNEEEWNLARNVYNLIQGCKATNKCQ